MKINSHARRVSQGWQDSFIFEIFPSSIRMSGSLIKKIPQGTGKKKEWRDWKSEEKGQWVMFGFAIWWWQGIGCDTIILLLYLKLRWKRRQKGGKNSTPQYIYSICLCLSACVWAEHINMCVCSPHSIYIGWAKARCGSKYLALSLVSISLFLSLLFFSLPQTRGT